MIDREKVISGMVACTDHRNCEECPYSAEYDRQTHCMYALIMGMAEMIDELASGITPAVPRELKQQEEGEEAVAYDF